MVEDTKLMCERLRSHANGNNVIEGTWRMASNAAALIEQQAARITALESERDALVNSVAAAGKEAVAIYQLQQVNGAWMDVSKPEFDTIACNYGRVVYTAPTAALENGDGRDAWQPIETAPKDGTLLILFARAKHATASAPVFGWWNPDCGWIESAFSPNHPVGIIPSHWMPRPKFPAALYQQKAES